MLLPGDRGPVPPPQQLPIAVSLPHRAVHGPLCGHRPGLGALVHHLPVGGCGGGPNSPLPTVLRGDVPFVLRATPRLEHVFSELYAAPEALRKGILEGKGTGTSALSLSLDPSQAPGEGNSCTRDQVELVEKVFAFLGTHRDQRYTAEQLAAAFTSPRSISGGA